MRTNLSTKPRLGLIVVKKNHGKKMLLNNQPVVKLISKCIQPNGLLRDDLNQLVLNAKTKKEHLLATALMDFHIAILEGIVQGLEYQIEQVRRTRRTA